MRNASSWRLPDLSADEANCYTIDVKDIARAIGLRPQTVYVHRCHDSTFPMGLRVGSKILFKPEDIALFYAKRFGYEPKFA